MESEGTETTEKNKFTLRSSFKKQKHKVVECNSVKSADEPAAVDKVINSIYCHRDENGTLIKHNPGKRNVVFSDKPVEIALAAPRTFSRNYLKANQKKKKNSVQSEGFYMFNPEVIQRLDNTDDFPKLSKKKKQAEDTDSGAAKPLVPIPPNEEVLTNANEQIKISYFKPPIAGTWAPPAPAPKKEGSDGESNSEDSSEENVYVVGQAERDEEVLNILSNGLDDEDDGPDEFFNDGTVLKETNIDDEIFSAKMTQAIEDASPKKFKETSLCGNYTNEENSSDTSSGSLDSGIHEAGTDSPVDETVPKPMVITLTPPEDVPKPEHREPQPVPQPIDSPVEDNEDETESTSAESETSSLNSDDLRPPSPTGHEMTYLQYDAEPMLPKYKRDLPTELEKAKVETPPSDVNDKSSSKKSPVRKGAELILEKTAPSDLKVIPQTSLENFFGPKESATPNQEKPQPAQHSAIYLRQQKEQQRLKEIQKQKEVEEQRLVAIQQQQELEELKLLELQRKQEEHRVLELQRLQEEQRQKIKKQQEQRRQQEMIEKQRQEDERKRKVERQREERLMVEQQRLQQEQQKQRQQEMLEKQMEFQRLEDERKRKELELVIAKEKEAEEAKRRELEIQIRREHELARLREVELEKRLKLEKERQQELEQQRQYRLLEQIEAEKQRQLQEQQRQRDLQKPVMVASRTEPDGLLQDFDDIDNLLMGLLDSDPLIRQQEQQKRLQQIEAEVQLELRKTEAEHRRKRQEELIKQREEMERLKRLEAERNTEEDEETRKEREIEEKRERKRKMREMSLEDVLKLQKAKKGSPTLSIRSENWNTGGTLHKRSSNESLNSYNTLSTERSGNQMIAPLSLLQEIINPNIVINDNYSTTDSFKSSTSSSDPSSSDHRTLPVIIDTEIISERSVSPVPDYIPRSVSDTISRRNARFDPASIPTKIETSPKVTRAEPSAFNSTVEPYIIKATIEPYNSAPPPGTGSFSPNTVQAKQTEQWLDIDDLLADIQLNVDKPNTSNQGSPALHPRSPNQGSPAVQPRSAASLARTPHNPSIIQPPAGFNSPGSLLISPKSANSSTSSYPEVFDTTPPPLPPKLPSRPGTPSSTSSQPALPPRGTLTRSLSGTPPISPNRTPPRSPNIPTKASASTSMTPPRSPLSPKHHSPKIPARTDNSDTFNKSAFQNFGGGVNPHESVRRRNSIDDLSKRAAQLSSQRNQQAYSSFRPGVRPQYYAEPQYGYSPEETNVTVPYYQPQRMYQDNHPSHSHTLPYNPPPPQQHPPYNPSRQAPYLPPRQGGQYIPPPRQYIPQQHSQQIYPSQQPGPPPQRSPPKRQGSDKILNSRHHTVV